MSSLSIHIPVGTGRKLNVLKTFSLRSVSTETQNLYYSVKGFAEISVIASYER